MCRAHKRFAVDAEAASLLRCLGPQNSIAVQGGRHRSPLRHGRKLMRALQTIAVLAATMIAGAAPAFGGDVVLFTFSEELDAFDPATGEISVVLPHEEYVNGYPCFFPGTTGMFVQAEDYDRDHDYQDCAHFPGDDAACDEPGWRIFKLSAADMKYHRVLSRDGGLINIGADQDDPLGCAFDPAGNLLATDVGSSNPIDKVGRFLIFFKEGGYREWCEIERLASTSYVILDADGSALVSETGRAHVLRYHDLPRSKAECADYVAHLDQHRGDFILNPLSLTPFGIVRKLDASGQEDGHYYVSSVFFPMGINEFDAQGLLVRPIALPIQNMPSGISVDHAGNVYFVELALVPVPQAGRFMRIQFDPLLGPLPPETLKTGLTVADGSRVVDSALLNTPPAE
jgi:hypothetical protein